MRYYAIKIAYPNEVSIKVDQHITRYSYITRTQRKEKTLAHKMLKGKIISKLRTIFLKRFKMFSNINLQLIKYSL